MITFLKILFGFRGTWLWACRRMKEGQAVYRLRDSGIVSFTYDKGRRKIKAMIDWEGAESETEWGISMEDVFATDLKLWPNIPDYAKMHYQSQMKTTD